MDRKFPHLCSPIQIGNVTFRNRMAAAPTGGTDISPEGCIGRRSIAYYEHRAIGGAASVTVAELVVDPETDPSKMFILDDDIPGSLSGFSYAADAIRRHGAIPSIEFSHGGRFAAYAERDKPFARYGPSAAIEANGAEIRELTVGQIGGIIEAYGRAATLAKRAGFEMIMIHGGHNWLINQFLTPCFNHRTDDYGGDIKNRCRFAIEAVECVRAAVGPGFPIEFRMSGIEALEGGYGLDTAVEIAKIIAPHIDLLHVSAGSHHIGFSVTHPSMFAPHGVNVYLAAEIKKHVAVPVATVGALGDPAKMEEIIASGKADVISMARALLADPYLPRKVMENRDDEIIKCLYCYTCNAERGKTKARRCTINPRVGREIEGFEIQPSRNPRRIMVAGGGPAGMVAALTAAQRGHTTVLCEKTDRLGGIPNCEEGVPFKEPMFSFAKTMGRLLQKEGVDIRLNKPVTPEYAESENIDALICAVGSEPIIPPIPGIEGKNVVQINDLPARISELGQKIVILGGGQAGCETAIYLANLESNAGKEVIIVEMQNTLAPDANGPHREVLMELLQGTVEIKLGYTGVRISDEGLYCMNTQNKEELINADAIIIAAGQRSRREEADSLRDAAPFVVQIGDCVAPKDMTTAIYQGYHAALDV